MPGPDMFVRIPKERVGVLIGPDGRIKKYIEDKLEVTLDIDTEGSVTIILSEKAQDPSLLLRAKDLVTAIGRGFKPETAFRLIRNEDEIFDMIDLRHIFGRSESDIRRIKSRIIGTEGKTRRLIEELTEADVVVYGHTIGIIGSFEQADAARNAIQMIIDGCEHHTMYNYLQKKRTELKKQKLQLWETPPEKK
ncbi:MAG: KH domain-containing protein [Candidatus Bathyarchaeota archaeon]|nr:KH domain-containing protein [Candidatus Bathyarchaeota archaeon]MDD4325490.1 KH domain-containing protein [Candidatus Bathyarchaeota archaeon]MDI9577745.1 KH domain-containing protein [Thermoproteota archaeon]MDT8782934.1 RNA-processing protein [Candidatus Bathyarchaeota archaeon]NLD66051.1 RNA-processing protein [Thermoproteota archaeon]